MDAAAVTLEQQWCVNLATVVRVLRMLNRKSLREQAEAWQMSPATLSRIENRKGCDLSTLAQITQATGISVESLLSGVKTE